MKKLTAFVFTLAVLLSFEGCGHTEDSGNDISPNPADTTPAVTEAPVMDIPVEANKEIESITKNTGSMELSDTEEPFFEDERYIYVFGNPTSEYVTVKYSDGSTENVKEALENGHIQITDLDKHKINYFTEPKHIETIVDMTESGEIATAEALECFFSDEKYTYYFPSIKSDYITVYYKDGTEQNVKDALSEGKINISALDWFGIQIGRAHV